MMELEPLAHRLGKSHVIQTYYCYFQDGSKLTKTYSNVWTLNPYDPHLMPDKRINKIVGNRNCIVHIVLQLESAEPRGKLKKRTKPSHQVKLVVRSTRNPLSEVKTEELPNAGIYITTRGQFLAAASNAKGATSPGNKFRREVLKTLYHNKRWIIWKRGPSPNARVLNLRGMTEVTIRESIESSTSHVAHGRFGSKIENEIERESTISVIAALKRPPRTWLKQLDLLI